MPGRDHVKHMEATAMKHVGIVSTAALSLLLGITAPAYAQEKQEEEAKPAQQEEKRAPEAKPAPQEEKKAEQEKPAKQEEKTAQQQDKNTKQEEKGAPQQEQKTQQAQRAGGGRIPDDRYKANFGREHTFRVSQADYSNRRFQYGGYAFEFVDPWPSNWLYTQDVYVVEMNGVYYLCNASFPGVNLALSFTP
jgi:cytoskeletal protein RodZ